MPNRPLPVRGGPTPSTVRALVRWFRHARRPLPWRASRDPYRIWVAEVLLQQTRVEQAVPYFERFLARFPDLDTLARAPRASVLKAWQGAGYYARARHLHEAARRLVRDHGGSFPRTVGELERLPGVGAYTARAVAALAFGARAVPMDANLCRVGARWFLERRPVGEATVRASLQGRLERLLPLREPGEFVEAVMELGETVCLPNRPRCGVCPVAQDCRARSELVDPGALPTRRRRAPRPLVRGAVVALHDGERWLVQRRSEAGLLGGLWEFPGGKIEPGETPPAAARRELTEETGATVGPLIPVGIVRHGYSHFAVELHVFAGSPRRTPRLSVRRRWATTAEIGRLPLPRATEKIVALLPRGGPAAGSRAVSSRGPRRARAELPESRPRGRERRTGARR